MIDKPSICGICGEPMPPGEEMFKYHGYSGPCPKPAKAISEGPQADAVRLDYTLECSEGFTSIYTCLLPGEDEREVAAELFRRFIRSPFAERAMVQRVVSVRINAFPARDAVMREFSVKTGPARHSTVEGIR